MDDRMGARWDHLCAQIATEQNLRKFSALFDEICLLLEQREAELMKQQNAPPASMSQGDGIAG